MRLIYANLSIIHTIPLARVNSFSNIATMENVDRNEENEQKKNDATSRQQLEWDLCGNKISTEFEKR